MHKYLLLLFISIFFQRANAWFIQLATEDGDPFEMECLDGLMVKCQNDNLVFMSAEDDITILSIPIQSLHGFNYSKESILKDNNTTSRNEFMSEKPTVTLKENVLTLCNMDTGEHVKVVDVEGRIHKNLCTTTSELSIYLGDLPGGVFILMSSKLNFKFIKP